MTTQTKDSTWRVLKSPEEAQRAFDASPDNWPSIAVAAGIDPAPYDVHVTVGMDVVKERLCAALWIPVVDYADISPDDPFQRIATVKEYRPTIAEAYAAALTMMERYARLRARIASGL